MSHECMLVVERFIWWSLIGCTGHKTQTIQRLHPANLSLWHGDLSCDHRLSKCLILPTTGDYDSLLSTDAYSQPTMYGGNRISGRADSAHSLGSNPLSSATIASFFLPSPPFSYQPFPSAPITDHQVQLGGLGSAVSCELGYISHVTTA